MPIEVVTAAPPKRVARRRRRWPRTWDTARRSSGRFALLWEVGPTRLAIAEEYGALRCPGSAADIRR
jgi:hypothetical protein